MTEMTPGTFSRSDSVHQKQPLAKVAFAVCENAGTAMRTAAAAMREKRFMRGVNHGGRIHVSAVPPVCEEAVQPELAAIIRAIDRWRDKSVPLPLGSVVPVRATDTPRFAGESRVHSFDRYVIGDLTFHRYRADANVAGGTADFVQSILDRLPEGIVNRSFFAWDVARDLDGRRVVIEVNLTGMHPVFRPGFQTSGHLQHDTTGAWAAAMLVRHIERCLGISIEVDGDAVLPDEFAKAA